MTKDILLLGEFSTGKSAFINMLLGVSILPERLESTDLPVIKIHNVKPSGLWLRELGQKNPLGLDSWSEIPSNWDLFEHVEIVIHDHPLLSSGITLWDTPGINSTNQSHIKHLENFLKSRTFDQVLFFTHGNMTGSAIQFLNKFKELKNQMYIIVNIKDVKPEQESRLIERQVKKEVWTRYANVPVELVYSGDLYEEFMELSESLANGNSEWELIKGWKERRIDLATLLNRNSDRIIGKDIFDVLLWRSECAKSIENSSKEKNISNYYSAKKTKLPRRKTRILLRRLNQMGFQNRVKGK